LLVRSVIGVLAIVLAFGPLVVGTRRLRARLLPTWSGPPGVLVQFVLVLTACLVVILGLGVIGWYSLVPTTLALAAIGIGCYYIGGRLDARTVDVPVVVPERLGRPARLVAVISISLVAATWGARTYVALSHGMVSIDSLWYHLPLAARYSELHSITGVFHDVDNLSGFYPVNVELLHSLGMVFLGNDLLSMVMNLGWGIVALLAAWCIGRPYGVAAVCVTTTSVLLCAPAFVGTQPGAAHVDIVGVTLVLAVAALLVSASPTRVTSDRVVLALAAMLVGFAVGTKWTLVPIAVLLSVGVLVFQPRGRRLWTSAMWLSIVAVIGSFSYLRNWAEAGSPLPPVDAKVGPIGWERKVPEAEGMSSVSKFLFDTDAWQTWLLPGLSTWFGYAWWAALALVFLGWILAVVTGPGSLVRMLGLAAAAAFVAYVVQPQVLEISGQPYYFAANLRYGTAAMALGLALLPLSPVFTRRWLLWSVSGIAVTVTIVMQFDSAVWPVELRDLRWEQPVRGADVVAGLVAGLVALVVGVAWVYFGKAVVARANAEVRRVSSARWSARTALLSSVAVVVLVVGVVGLDRFYLDRRYARPDAATPFLPEHWASWSWARNIEGQRIGYRAPALSYPLYGNRLTNFVEAFPEPDARGADGLPDRSRASCERFKRMVNDRRYDYVVIFSNLAPPQSVDPSVPSVEVLSPQLAWLDADPRASRSLRGEWEAVYRIDGRLDPAACPDPTAGAG
jgi:hypothetical protein